MHLDEDIVKARCIDLLLSRHCDNEEYVIINELPFADGKRRADIVEVNGQINAYEIKSDLDSLRKLEEQFEDYKKTFDTITVVVTLRHLSGVRELLPKSVGIILVDEQGAFQIRKPASYRQHNKYFLAALLDTQTMNSLSAKLNLKNVSRLSTTDRRLKVAKTASRSTIRLFAMQSLKEKHGKAYANFINYRGKSTLVDDLPLLWSGIITQ